MRRLFLPPYHNNLLAAVVTTPLLYSVAGRSTLLRRLPRCTKSTNQTLCGEVRLPLALFFCSLAHHFPAPCAPNTLFLALAAQIRTC